MTSFLTKISTPPTNYAPPANLWDVPDYAVKGLKYSVMAVPLLWIENGHRYLLSKKDQVALKICGLIGLAIASIVIASLAFTEAGIRAGAIGVAVKAFEIIAFLIVPIAVLAPDIGKHIRHAGTIFITGPFTSFAVIVSALSIAAKLFQDERIDAKKEINGFTAFEIKIYDLPPTPPASAT